MTGFTVDLGAAVAAPGSDLVEQHQPLPFLQPTGGLEHGVTVVDGAGVEVGVEHDLPGDRKPIASAARRAGVALGVEVERGLGAGEVAERGGTAGVEGQARPEGLEGGGAVGQGAVQVEGVGEVELGLEPHGAGVVHVLGVQGGVAGVDGEVAVLRIGSRVQDLQVVAA